MGKLRLPRTLLFVTLSGATLAVGAAGCGGSSSRDVGCVPSAYYDDGGMVPPDAIAHCPSQPDKNGNCPRGCEPVV